MKTRKKVLIGAGNQELQVSSSPAQARGISDKGYSDANLSTAKGYTDSEIQKLDSSASPASGNNVLTGITITDGKITGSTSASAVLTSGNQTIAGNKTFSGDTTLSGLVTAGKTNFISSSNEFNFIPAGFDNVVHINYRSASGAAAAVSSYYFDSGDSSGGLADLYAKKGVFTSLQSATAPDADDDVIRKYEWNRAYLNKIAQFSSLPSASGRCFLTYNNGNSDGQKFGWTWESSLPSTTDVSYAQWTGALSAIAAIGATLTKCTNSTETITLGLKEAIVIYQYTGYSNGSMSLSGGSWESGYHYGFGFPCMILPYYAGAMGGSTKGFLVAGTNEEPSVYVAASAITVTLNNANDTLFYKKFTLIP